jgi:transcriptional regulator with XRE-family HTH domain
MNLNPLKEARKKKKKTIESLAKDLNIGRDTLSKYEKGEGNPGLVFVKKWCDALDVKIGFVTEI